MFQFVWGWDPVPYDDPFFHDLYKERKWKWKVEYQAELMALRFSAQISSFLRHRDHYHMVVLYEDILSDPRAVCEELLQGMVLIRCLQNLGAPWDRTQKEL